MALAKIEIEVSVVVVVEEGDRAAHVFGGVQMTDHAVVVREVDAQFRCAVDEYRLRILGRERRRGNGGNRQRRKGPHRDAATDSCKR